MQQMIPRQEFPRPDFERSEWICLNGPWKFDFDDLKIGEKSGWCTGDGLTRSIVVPFCYQSDMSGIGDNTYHPVVWYSKAFTLGKETVGKRVLLKFGAVDYEADVWINGIHAGNHKGGHTSFCIEISELVKQGENTLAVRALDDRQCDRARGKQYWKDSNDRCWYTPTTGIWQSVWLEFAGSSFLEKVRLTPDIDRRTVEVEAYLSGETKPGEAEIEACISYMGMCRKVVRFSAERRVSREIIALAEEDYIDEIHYWTPEHPNLYDIELSVIKNGQVTDRVKSYFGMRKIERVGDMIHLNNKPYYQKLILDQGYWTESLLTPPSDEAIRSDVEMTKAFGFNGARKHQKFEDPRYYYWADRLGLLVWGELPSGYFFNSDEVTNLTHEWTDFVQMSYNHPCIITWVIFNESWGIRNVISDARQQSFVKGLYHLTKALDSTRLISSNDGWEMTKDTEIFGIHDYVALGEEFNSRYSDFESFLKTGNGKRVPLCNGSSYMGQPVLITEYGGIAFQSEKGDDWGYNGSVRNEQEFLARLDSITSAIKKTSYIRGFCYTQLTDVFQEVNGLMTMERKTKIDPEKIRKIFA